MALDTSSSDVMSPATSWTRSRGIFQEGSEVTTYNTDTEFWLMLEQAGHHRTANKPCASKEGYIMAVVCGGEAEGGQVSPLA